MRASGSRLRPTRMVRCDGATHGEGTPAFESGFSPGSAVTRWTPFERVSGLLFVVLVSTLTLEWIVIGKFITGIRYYHLAVVAFMGVYLMRYRPDRRLALILRRYRAFYGPWALYLLLVAVIGLASVDPHFREKNVALWAFYGTASVFFAAFFLDANSKRTRAVLQWTGVVTVCVVMAGIGLSLLGQGVNPFGVIADAIARGDPTMVRKLLRLSFGARANLRHKVFSAVLIGCAVTLICRERSHGPYSCWRNRLFLVSAALGALLVIGSLSRSMILCLVIVLGLYGLRTVLQSRATPRHLAVSIVILAAIVVIVASPLGSLVRNRLAETGSYQTRVAAIWSAVQPRSLDAAVLGVDASEVAVSPHNLVLNAWLSAGVVGAVATAVSLFIYLRVWLREVRRYMTGGEGWMLPLHHFWVIAVGVIPLVRAVTAGNGFHLTDWICIGIVFGLVEANRRAAAGLAPSS